MHTKKQIMDLEDHDEARNIPGFRRVPRTGVIYVMHRATRCGYSGDDKTWINLGQGAPETGILPEAPSRVGALSIEANRQEYSPIPGHRALRQKVADFYNQMYRRDKTSKYTYENVSISGGRRIALTRIAASLGHINMGHFIPDYTAYEELLTAFHAFIPIPILLEPEGTFYAWVDLSQLPSPLNDGFKEGLKEKVITVPGVFFDVNPGKRRSRSRYQNYCRVSFGPEMEKLVRGFDGIERMIKRFK